MQYAFTYIFFVVFSQLIIACRKGGTSIEDLAEKFPDMIVKVVILLFYFWWLMIIIDRLSIYIEMQLMQCLFW